MELIIYVKKLKILIKYGSQLIEEKHIINYQHKIKI